jgi:hypothetical protein
LTAAHYDFRYAAAAAAGATVFVVQSAHSSNKHPLGLELGLIPDSPAAHAGLVFQDILEFSSVAQLWSLHSAVSLTTTPHLPLRLVLFLVFSFIINKWLAALFVVGLDEISRYLFLVFPLIALSFIVPCSPSTVHHLLRINPCESSPSIVPYSSPSARHPSCIALVHRPRLMPSFIAPL